MYYNMLVLSQADGPLDCVHLGAVVNNNLYKHFCPLDGLCMSICLHYLDWICGIEVVELCMSG